MKKNPITSCCRIALSAVVLAAVRLAAVEVGELNLIGESTFKPVVMHGRTSAAYGWAMRDAARQKAGSWNKGKYLSGEGLFFLKVENGTMTLAFPEKLHPAYKNNGVEFVDVIHGTMMKGKFRVRARVKVEKGRFSIGKRKLENSPEWQEIDFVSPRMVTGFKYQPVAGGGFSISRFSVCPEYDKLGGEINLPDGGKLVKLLLPRNADQPTRWCVALWQNYLWRLTGTALPVEVVDTVKPTPGALAVIKGETAPGGWQLKVDKNGIVLTYGSDLVFWPAMADYLRDLGHTIYSHKLPLKIEPDPAFVLKAVDKTIKPRYRYFTSAWYMAGLVDPMVTRTRNLADYYHMYKDMDSHNVNIVMPTEMYYQKHSEYYAMNKKGERPLERYIIQQSPCFSNKDAFEISAKNFVDYALGMPERPYTQFGIGDAENSCLCPECLKINGGKPHDYSNLLMMFLNRVARELREKRPDTRIPFGAYADTMAPPLGIKPEPNVVATYCLTYQRLPCTLHQDCELNRAGLEEIKAWSRYIGRDKLGPMTYRDMRPLHAVERLKMLNQYMGEGIFSWIWMGFSPAIPFVVGRWNLGDDDVNALLEEFNDRYYGKAGKFVTEANKVIEEYAKNYRHTPEELRRYRQKLRLHVGIRCADPYSHPALDRATLDKLYAIFDRGVAAIGDSDKLARRHTLEEKAFYILEDLLRYRIGSCKTDAELARYAARVVELVRIAREVPALQEQLLPLRNNADMFTLFTGITLKPSKKAWCFRPEVEEFLKDPVKAMSGAPERVPGGLRFSPRTMRGGSGPAKYSWQCPPRVKNSINRASSGRGEITLNFKLDRDMPEVSFLVLTGLDDDKPGASRFAVEVNGERVFEGANTFPEHDWGKMTVRIPGNLLKKDANSIRIVNTTPEDPQYQFAADYTWGWIAFSEAAWLDPNGGFKTFLKGNRRARGGWYQADGSPHKPLGRIEIKGGKLHIRGGDARQTGVFFFRRHRFPKLAASPWRTATVKVTAAGEGKLTVDFEVYGAKRIIGRRAMNKSFRLSTEPKTFTATFAIPPGAVTLLPEVVVNGKGKAVVSSIEMDLGKTRDEK